MSRARKICVVTGSRAEYGLLYWLMREIESDPDLELQVLVTGMHLSPTFGYTVSEIEADGFAISTRVDIDVSASSPAATARSIALGVEGATEELDRLRPDIVLVLGDRYEIFAAAQAAMLLGIPIAHIHGGESTEGAIDEAMRHAITKMAHLHFVAADAYRRRVIQLGEDPNRVFTTGAMVLDAITNSTLLDRDPLLAELSVPAGTQCLIACTFHPVTLEATGYTSDIEELLSTLEAIPDAYVVLTGANADAGGDEINARLKQYAELHRDSAQFVTNLGHQRYMSLVKHADLVLGNSSSGIIEAPLLRTATVNIGNRQSGRLRAPSIIDCTANTEAIGAAIAEALTPEHQTVVAEGRSAYGNRAPAPEICRVLREHSLHEITTKRFWDLPERESTQP